MSPGSPGEVRGIEDGEKRKRERERERERGCERKGEILHFVDLLPDHTDITII